MAAVSQHLRRHMQELRIDHTRTARRSSSLAFGCAQFGGAYGKEFPQKEATQLVAHAFEQGIRIFDTAPWYGNGVSEERLGTAIREAGIPHSQVRIHTKAGRQHPDRERMFDFSHDGMRQSIRASMQRLQVESIDCLQVHDPEFAPSLQQLAGETLPAMAAALEAGETKALGLTGYPLSVMSDMLQHALAQGVPIHSVLSYCRYAMYDTTLAESDAFLNTVRRSGTKLIAASPFGMGLLVPSGPPEWHPSGAELRAACAVARRVAAAGGVSLPRLAAYFSGSSVEAQPFEAWAAPPAPQDDGVQFAQEGEHDVPLYTVPSLLLASASSPEELDQLVAAVSTPQTPWEQAVTAVLVGRHWLTFDADEHLPFQLEEGDAPPLPVEGAFTGLDVAVAAAAAAGADKLGSAEAAYDAIVTQAGPDMAPRLPGGLFGWLGSSQRHWEGVEVGKHWSKLQRQPDDASMLGRYLHHR